MATLLVPAQLLPAPSTAAGQQQDSSPLSKFEPMAALKNRDYGKSRMRCATRWSRLRSTCSAQAPGAAQHAAGHSPSNPRGQRPAS
jgi:hypothetical protein